MIMLWITLLCLHPVYTLVTMKTVQLGEAANFTCSIQGFNGEIHWYKQTVGDTLKLIVTLYKSAAPRYGPEFSQSRFDLRTDNSFSNLTILRTVEEDEGMYHCGVTEWIKINWSGTYLLVEGNTERTIVQTVSYPVRPGDSVTLQCSVLSDSENKTCPGDLSVFWFRAGSQTSHPNIIYTDGDTNNKCEKRSETQKRCDYSFSKDVSSSDAGTYYCAVATCGEILFGNGTKLETDQAAGSEFAALMIAVICLAISIIVHFVFICYQTPRAECEEYDESTSSRPTVSEIPTRSLRRANVKMIVLWVTLLVLHHANTLTPVIPVELGEAATLTCALSNTETTHKEIHWYKQTVPDTLKSIVKFRKSVLPEYAPEFSNSRWEVHNDNNFSNLTISRITQEDEGLYHCGIAEWLRNTEWSGTYLLVKGNTERTSNYTVVQTVSGSVRPGDSVTLQCSVLSESENKTCPGNLSVLWFRDGSQKSPSNIVYTEGKTHYECEKKSNSQKRCVYSFSKNVSSSDAGTYYCAVATCGEILFGNGTKLTIEAATGSEFIVLVVAVICLAISVIINIILICRQTPRAVCVLYKGSEGSTSQAKPDNLSQPVHEYTEDNLNYAALRFSGPKPTRGRKKKELNAEESVYSYVKC
ncbi:uncharacterized protein LOC125008540 [Mugil cephalus]|uniref:uncharacterized protein LOC125008540 n=1 Tax=Mugil cephalus TaxID=48193 RepID=UPI001FB64189|nr:uncharacterized protein LOC125008540 [Mugil cephalus]